MQEFRNKQYYFFVNTISGRELGKQYLTLHQKTLTYITEGYQTVAYLYDFVEEDDRLRGLQQVKEKAKNQHIYIVICGGDGTVGWVLTEINHFEIETINITFAILPIGSGNDFSRTLKWGAQSILFDGFDLQNLLQMLSRWENSQEIDYDLWDIEIITHENGGILTVKQESESKGGNKRLSKTFASYCGLGIDGRTSYFSEKMRISNSVTLNKILYGIIGTANFFVPAPNFQSIIYKFTHQQKEEDPEQEVQKQISLKLPWHSIVFMNGQSFMAGVKNIWRPDTEQGQTQQALGDGKLEVIGFKSQFSLVMERLMNAGDNIYQGGGLFWLQFEQQNKQTTYMQLDGQPLMIINPKSIRIRNSKISKTGKIRVLCNTNT